MNTLPTITNANQAPLVKEIANANTVSRHAKPANFRTVLGIIVDFAIKRCTGNCISNMEPKKVAV